MWVVGRCTALYIIIFLIFFFKSFYLSWRYSSAYSRFSLHPSSSSMVITVRIWETANRLSAIDEQAVVTSTPPFPTLAVSCPRLEIPKDAWLRRDGDNARIECNKTGEVWYLTCRDGRWIGDLGNCTGETAAQTVTTEIYIHLNEALEECFSLGGCYTPCRHLKPYSGREHTVV